MQIKNKMLRPIIFFIILFGLNLNLYAEEFNISAIEISIDKANDIVIGKGSVEVTDIEGNLIKADKVIYHKSKEFLIVEGFVEFSDTDGNIIKTDKITYDQFVDLVEAMPPSDYKEYLLEMMGHLTSSQDNPYPIHHLFHIFFHNFHKALIDNSSVY